MKVKCVEPSKTVQRSSRWKLSRIRKMQQEEGSVSAVVGSYMTPKAFTRKKNRYEY